MLGVRGLSSLWRTITLCALGATLGASASPSNEPTLEELKARLSSTSIGDRPHLCVQIAEKQLAEADKLYAAAEVENLAARSENRAGGKRFLDVCVDVVPRLGTDEIDLLVPAKQLLLEAVEAILCHDAAATRIPRRKCIRRMAIAAGVTPGMRPA